MADLARRLTALEHTAEAARRREIRTRVLVLLEAHNLTPTETEAAVDAYLRDEERIAEWQRVGVSEREIIRRCADAMGMTVPELEAECAAISAPL